MALPNSGDTVPNVYIYQETVGVPVGQLLSVTTVTPIAGAQGVPATFGTDGAGDPTISYGGNTMVMTAEGNSQSPTAFTYTNGPNTYIVSNGPISSNIAGITVPLLNTTVLLGGLGDIGLTQGATDYVACYLAGTMILTDRGEIAVEDLVIGDRLITASGAARPLKWIGTRSYAGGFIGRHVMPVCIKRGAMADGVPHRDLYVSPRHAVFIDGALFPAGLLLNGESIVTVTNLDVVQYFHLELDSHDVILAEGTAAESFVDDDSRNIFQNARDYRALYPASKPVPARYCASRIEDGYRLEEMIQRLATRGRLLQPEGTLRVLGRLIGSLDRLTPGMITGWARNDDAPDDAVMLSILDNGVVIDEVLASRHRPDVQAAGIGHGCYGFSVGIPGQLSALSDHVISVRRKADGTELSGSPMTLTALSMVDQRQAA
jgi:hypothetical protein